MGDPTETTGRPDPSGDGALLEHLVFRCLEAADREAELHAIEEEHPGRCADVRRLLVEIDEGDSNAAGRDLVAGALSQVPSQLASYRLVRKLGSGGMGVVFEAIDELRTTTVAIKVVRLDVLNPQASRLRFAHEIAALARLDHPAIVRILDSGQDQGLDYLVMERVHGETLADIISRLKAGPQSKPLASLVGSDLLARAPDGSQTASSERSILSTSPWVEACLRVARDLALALVHAHEAGILHRDIKPSNVMIDERGRVRLLDFGLALASDRTTMTRTGVVLGSLAYLPPEQLLGERATVDQRSDIYAVGVVLYELLTLTSPFYVENNADATRVNILAGAPRKLRRLNRAVRPEVEAVCRAAMDKQAERRHASAVDLVHDLEGVLGAHRLRSGSLLRRFALRNPVTSATIALLGSVVAIVGVFALLRMTSDYEAEKRERATLTERSQSLEADKTALELRELSTRFTTANASLDNGSTGEARILLAQLLARPKHATSWEERYLAHRLLDPVMTWRGFLGNAWGTGLMPDGDSYLWTTTDRLLAVARRDRSVVDNIKEVGGLPLRQANSRIIEGGRYAYIERTARRNVFVVDVIKGRTKRLDFGVEADELDFSRDGSVLAVALESGGVVIVDAETGNEVLRSLAGSTLASAIGLATRSRVRWLEMRLSDDKSMVFGSHASAGDKAAKTSCWRIPAGDLLWTRDEQVAPFDIDCGSNIGVGLTTRASLDVFDLRTGKQIVEIVAPAGRAMSEKFAIDPKRRVVWCVTRDHRVSAYHLDSRTFVATLPNDGHEVTMLDVDGKADTLVLGELGGRAHCRALGDASRSWFWSGAKRHVESLNVEPSGTLVACNRDASPVLHRPDGRNETLSSLPACHDLVWLGEGMRAAAPRRGKDILLHDENSASVVGKLTGHEAPVRCLALLDPQLLVSGAEDGTLRVWDLTTKSCTKTVHIGSRIVRHLRVSPDRRYIATGDQDARVCCWNATDLSLYASFGGIESVYALAFDPTSRFLAAGGKSNTTHIFELDKRQVVAWLPLRDRIASLCFSPDGTRLFCASAGESGLQVVNTATWTESMRIRTGTALSCVAVSPDGVVVIGDYEGVVRILGAR